MENFRPLLPVGYDAGVDAYRRAVAELTPVDLSEHYTHGAAFFQERFVPHLKRTIRDLSGGVWDLGDYVAYAAGSDVDLMTHIVEAVAVNQRVSLFPGDWYGFRVGCTQTHNIHWDAAGAGELACLCIPSVRNGHVTDEMLHFLESSRVALLNLNLFPTLLPKERRTVAEQLNGLLPKSILSISFSRGFGLTASQLGVVLVHRDHPYRQRFGRQWEWFTNFYNSIAARAFMLLALDELHDVDDRRRDWVTEWLSAHDLPAIPTGSYYVKTYQPIGELPAYLAPLAREGVVRLCFKPTLTH